ncbi:MAG: hypothetical protein KA257_00270 [Opitutaceae bacterium]|nr:hypothetical protein [Opitutaceae bacterium]
MKLLLPVFILVLCGCRTAAPVAPLPVPASVKAIQPQPVPPSVPAVPTPVTSTSPDPKSRQQAQLIEALINQNDALTARLTALRAAPATAPVASETTSVKIPPSPVVLLTAPAFTDATITPNADGVIDLVAVKQAGAVDEPVNPFAVRATHSESAREVSLVVGGIIMGAAPCAMVNERLVQVGDPIERFVVEQIDVSAVIVRFGVHRLRLPVSTVPTRVKLLL